MYTEDENLEFVGDRRDLPVDPETFEIDKNFAKTVEVFLKVCEKTNYKTLSEFIAEKGLPDNIKFFTGLYKGVQIRLFAPMLKSEKKGMLLCSLNPRHCL